MKTKTQRTIDRVEFVMRPDESPDTSCGVFARATVYVSGVRQSIQSGGLWGVESDGDASYFEELKAEQLAELREVLAVRLGNAQLSPAFRGWSGEAAEFRTHNRRQT